MIIRKRIPETKYLFPVYGLIVMFIYGWSLFQFIRDLPGWIKFLTPGEISSILAYTFVFDLLESILFLAGLIVISIILPTKWFRDDFIVRGGVIALYLLVLFMFVANKPDPSDLPNDFIIRRIIDLALLQYVVRDVSLLKKVLVSLADRSTVFLYLSIPASLLALIVVLYRNISVLL